MHSRKTFKVAALKFGILKFLNFSLFWKKSLETNASKVDRQKGKQNSFVRGR